MRDLTQAESDTLESLIDRAGLYSTVLAMADIARLKAEHIRTTRQDNRLAMTWDHAAKQIESGGKRIPTHL